MSNLKATDKKLLEILFEMKSGYVLDFSDRTMGDFFKEEFKIDIYDKKYDSESLTRSKANRLRGIWLKEDDKTVGKIILSLTDYLETGLLTQGKEIAQNTKDLAQKCRGIGTKLLFSELSEDFQPEIQALKNKAQLIKDFNSVDLENLKTNEKIYLLKIFYSYYEAIIKAYYGSGLFFLNFGIEDLSDYFKILRKRMIEIINSEDTFSEIKTSNAYGQVIETMTSLYSSAEYLDVIWEDIMLPSITNLREEIADKDLFQNNSEIHKVSIAVSSFLEIISKEVATLKDFLGQKTKNFYEEELPEKKKQFKDAFGSKKGQTIKHEHTHHFENSIQEKDILVNIKNIDENVVVKNNGKRATLPKFPRTEWAKVSITFLGDRDVLLSDGKNTKPSSFVGLGCDDGRNGRPDDNWDFLLKLAQGNGQTLPISKKEREKHKKQKQKITDILRKIFGTETDPFETETGGVYKSKFNIKYTNNEKPPQSSKYSDLEEVFSEMTEPPEDPE